MKEKEKEDHRRDLLLILLIVPLGVLCMFLTGQQAIKLAPSWTLVADMGSNLDPDVDFSVKTNPELMEPIDANILTQPVWGNLFLTPNAIIPTRIIQTKAPTPQPLPTTQPTVSIPTSLPTLIPPPTIIVIPPPTNPPSHPPTKPPPPPPPPPPPTADLSVTVNDDGTPSYTSNGAVTYTITISNLSGSSVTGATITDNFSALLTNVSWTCVGSGGASCTPGPVTGNINDVVNLPVGDSVTYTVTADVIAAPPNSDLVNTATVAVPAGYVDSDGSNNSKTDTDFHLYTPSDLGIETTNPPVNLGAYYALTAGSTVTFDFPTVVNGDAGWDLIYYEYRSGPNIPPDYPGILLDWVIIQIGDGTNWYTVFYWGDELRDTNTNMDYGIPLPDPPPGNPPFPPPVGTEYEGDQRVIPATALYNGTGVAIDLDMNVAPSSPPGSPAPPFMKPPNNTYPYLRIIAPTGDVDGQLEIDGLFAITP